MHRDINGVYFVALQAGTITRANPYLCVNKVQIVIYFSTFIYVGKGQLRQVKP